MMTKEELDALLDKSIVLAHARVADLSRRGAMPVGANLFCRVMWPRSHKGEHFLLCGPQADSVIDISPLNEAAGKRVAESGGGFLQWWGLQDPHEQFAFVISVQIRVLKYAEQSGLVLAH